VSRRAAKPLVRRALADRDVDDAIDHYLIESAAVAEAFVDALRAAYEGIRHSPEIGALRYAHALNLPGLRFWKCGRYPYLVFYLERADRIEVLRVLHERRDIPRWLQDDGESSTLELNDP